MPRKSRKNVGLIGLGIIGSRVAAALRSSGWHVYVWNRTPRAEPNFLASPAEVAELCDVIQIFVSDSQALFDVLDAISDRLTPQHVVLCDATVGPEATLEAAKLVEDRGAKFLDAPFTGSKDAATNKQLVYYIGGEDETFRRVEPILKSSSKAIVRIGKIGDAATIKVVTNLLGAVSTQVLAEALAIVKASGIAPEMLANALEPHGARSGLTDQKLPKMLARDYEPHFSMKHMFKDVQLGIHIANSLDVDLPATTATAGVMYGALTRGWADLDYSALAKIYQADEERAEEEKNAESKELQKSETAENNLSSAAAEKAPIKHAEANAAPAKEVIAPPKETLSNVVAPPILEAELISDLAPPKIEVQKVELQKNETPSASNLTSLAPAATAQIPVPSDVEKNPPQLSTNEPQAASISKSVESQTKSNAAAASSHSLLNAEDLKALGAKPNIATSLPPRDTLGSTETTVSAATTKSEEKKLDETTAEESAKTKPPFNRFRRWFGPGAS
jgi:3-hydroxyisobutyrate dehydrogenase-like beta-hydroxyacid dehydrogenase